jgi:guanine deaminase
LAGGNRPVPASLRLGAAPPAAWSLNLEPDSNPSSSSADVQAIRGEFVHFLGDPVVDGARAMVHVEDGLLLVRDGRVVSLQPASGAMGTLPAGAQYHDYSGKLILPGFVDTHVHYSQLDVIASYGEQLLTWLERYTFPAERSFGNAAHAAEVAGLFIEEMLRNGTTSAMVFPTVHPQSVDAIFEAAASRRMRIVSGKVMMDRNCPPYLCDTAASSYDDSRALIEKWHGRGRLGYAVTPRFAASSTEAQLEAAGALLAEFPDVGLQSHVAENRKEVAWAAELFPWSRSYLDIYDRYGLLRRGAVYAHCIHLDDTDRRRMAETGAMAAFSPTSNLFLGSGFFDGAKARAAGMRFAVATDVGGGTSFSMLQTLNEAYKVAQCGNWSLTPADAFYLATLGGARALGVDAHIGNFEPGKEADLVVLDPAATPLLERRTRRAESIDAKLFLMMMLGDDRATAATHILGAKVWTREAAS